MQNNYALQTEQARLLFSRQDLGAIAHRHNLRAEPSGFWLEFCGKPYWLHREDARVLRADGTPAGFEETLSIYDLLNHTQVAPLAGEWCSIYALPHTLHSGSGIGPAAGTGETGVNAAQFLAACQSVGTALPSKADYSFQIPVFGKLSVLLQYWQADDEFPAKLQCLWDKNAREFVLFETMFYIMRHLYQQLGFH